VSTFTLRCATTALSLAAGIILGRLTAEPALRELRTAVRRLAERAGTDQLTGLPNRTTAATDFLLRAIGQQETLVVVLDLDRFKHINDSWGHRAGDELLRVTAHRLAAAATARHGTAARLGGDEFLLLLPATGGDPTAVVAQILASLAQPTILPSDSDIVVVLPSASAGITVHDGHHGLFGDVLHQADIALYHAKQRRGAHARYRTGMRMPAAGASPHTRPRDQHPAHGGEATR
jgi:diguanylate cyclase (GGDEF)-like protein